MNEVPATTAAPSDAAWWIATTAHDLAGPLLTMQGFLATLEGVARRGDWEALRDDIARLQRCCRTLTDRVRELRDLAGPASRSGFLSPCALEVAAARAWELTAGLRTHAVSFHGVTTLPTIPGDPIAWVRIFQNLFANAFAAGAGRIELRVTESPTAWTLEVIDDGQGFEPQFSDSAAEAVSREVSPGVSQGLGLEIVRQLLARHGATLTLRSAGAGRGATARIQFPQPVPVQASDAPPAD